MQLFLTVKGKSGFRKGVSVFCLSAFRPFCLLLVWSFFVRKPPAERFFVPSPAKRKRRKHGGECQGRAKPARIAGCLGGLLKYNFEAVREKGGRNELAELSATLNAIRAVIERLSER